MLFSAGITKSYYSGGYVQRAHGRRITGKAWSGQGAVLCGSPGKLCGIVFHDPSLRNLLFGKRENMALSMPEWDEHTHL